MTIQNPSRASTVVLCKITTKWPHKILLIKRSENVSFLPGAHVFPGGRVEENDKNFADLLAHDQENLNRIQAHFNYEADTVLMHVSAAIRETFEESGLSILYEKHGALLTPCLKDRLKNLLDNKEARANPCLDNLWPISWWITPVGEARRYDTWFFLATIEETAAGDNLNHPHDKEISGSLWISPKDALTAFKNGHIFLAPPTRTILERMDNTASLQDFLSYVDRPLFPIRPYFVADPGDKPLLVLPGDPLHHEQQKSAMPMHTRYFFN